MNAVKRIWRRWLTGAGDLPDLPEVRHLLWLAFWNGATFGALENKLDVARQDAYAALDRYARKSHPLC